MCNLYGQTRGQPALIEFTRAMVDRTGNQWMQLPCGAGPICYCYATDDREITTMVGWDKDGQPRQATSDELEEADLDLVVGGVGRRQVAHAAKGALQAAASHFGPTETHAVGGSAGTNTGAQGTHGGVGLGAAAGAAAGGHALTTGTGAQAGGDAAAGANVTATLGHGASANASVEAGASGSASVGAHGVSVSGQVHAGATATVGQSGHANLGNGATGTEQANAGVGATADANAHGGIGLDGVHGNAGAFAGANATASESAGISGSAGSISESGSVTTGEVGIGIDGHASYSDGTLSVGIGGGLGLGAIGIHGDLNVSLNVQPLIHAGEAVVQAVKDAPAAIENGVGAAAGGIASVVGVFGGGGGGVVPHAVPIANNHISPEEQAQQDYTAKADADAQAFAAAHPEKMTAQAMAAEATTPVPYNAFKST